MHSHPFRPLLLAALCAAGVSSCIRSDIGNTIGSIGKELPKAVPTHEAQSPIGSYNCYTATVYRKGDCYYAQLPIAFVPEKRCGFEYVPQFIGEPYVEVIGGEASGKKTLNDIYDAKELAALPVCRYYVEIRQDNAEVEHYSTPNERGACGELTAADRKAVVLKAAEDFNPADAECLGTFDLPYAVHYALQIPARRAWYNYPLIPLQYAAMVGVDIPLSLIIMPLSLPYVLCEPMIYCIDITQPE